MNWQLLFAQRTAQMRRSTVRELLKALAQPGMISFAGGIPAPELFPLEETARAAAAVLQQRGEQALQYGETEGVPELRDWIAARFSRPHCPVRRENVMIVTGSQQALDLLGKVFLDPGDRVLVENPTYLAMLSAWRPLQPVFVPVPSDADGLKVEALPPLLRQGAKLLYLVPNFQNPQGTTLSLVRRQQLLAALSGTSTVLVEDNPYSALRYSGQPLPDLLELDAAATPHHGHATRVGHPLPSTLSCSEPGKKGPPLPGPLLLRRRGRTEGALDQHFIPSVRSCSLSSSGGEGRGEEALSFAPPMAIQANWQRVIHLGTFSKTLAPGLRVGWVVAPAPVIDKLVQAKQAADLHTSTLCQHIILELLRQGVLERQLPRLCAAYRLRRDTMLAALAAHFPPGATWTRPEGGMFLLVTLPPALQAGALLPRALAQQVAFVPGDAFHLEDAGGNTLRLNFSNATPDQIQTGIRRLARVLADSAN